jgi:hypothetical protein
MLVGMPAGDSLAADSSIVAAGSTRRGLIFDPDMKAKRKTEAVTELNLSTCYVALTHAHTNPFHTIRKTPRRSSIF